MFTKLTTVLAITAVFTCWTIWIPGVGVFCYCTGEDPPPVVQPQPTPTPDEKLLTVNETFRTAE